VSWRPSEAKWFFHMRLTKRSQDQNGERSNRVSAERRRVGFIGCHQTHERSTAAVDVPTELLDKPVYLGKLNDSERRQIVNLAPEATTVEAPQMKAILDVAITMIKRQGTLPNSPCNSSGPKILLCAGAWIVRVGLSMLRSEEEAVSFERELQSTMEKSLILTTASKIGLARDLVEGLVRLNDSLQASERVAGVLSYLSGLRVGLAYAIS
jgi:hypothetical protein